MQARYDYSRFIPACAGNTAPEFCGAARLAVHPRVCGEHTVRTHPMLTTNGSSPRVRGTPFYALANCLLSRFIPACAGNTAPPAHPVPQLPVHPRVCGEHSSNSPTSDTKVGSSPRVRGTRPSVKLAAFIARFIPACAGNTHAIGLLCSGKSVHPRVCGEHTLEFQVQETPNGSSPRVRGTHKMIHREILTSRFIPACAGNTIEEMCQHLKIPVHPRVCGEHRPCQAYESRNFGSSPRVRGTQASQSCWAFLIRFIPACAGNTCKHWPQVPPIPVHPRVCGEHHARRHAKPSILGSSPRVRGTPLSITRHCVYTRFIPACAGNT